MTARPTPPHETTTPEPALYLLPVLCVRFAVPLPHEARGDRQIAAQYTLRLAHEKNMRACLVWDRRWSYWVWYARPSERTESAPMFAGGWVEATAGATTEPHAVLGGRRVALTFK